MHTVDKLKEAHFFLERVREHHNRPAFRFYLSAFLSAARSVTFALQKDLRSNSNADFERWYEEKRKQMDAHPMAKAVLTARNVFQKEGNKLYYTCTYGNEDQNRPQVVVEYNLESIPLTLDSIQSIRVVFPPARPRTLLSLVWRLVKRVFHRKKVSGPYWSRIPQRPGESEQEAISRWHTENFERVLADMRTSFEEGEKAWEVSLLPKMQKLEPEELLAQLESYLSVLDEVVEEAHTRFGTPQASDSTQ